jgi:deazaflavin-dependent oxidoreductase (nitroreductase family)
MAVNTIAVLLKKRRQISISVIGRRTGRTITLPVWFVCDDRALTLLPVSGSHTQWYRNLQKDRAITIQVGGQQHALRARLVKSGPAVRKVIEEFRKKYTPEEVKRWYLGLDVAVQVPFPAARSRTE